MHLSLRTSRLRHHRLECRAAEASEVLARQLLLPIPTLTQKHPSCQRAFLDLAVAAALDLHALSASSTAVARPRRPPLPSSKPNTRTKTAAASGLQSTQQHNRTSTLTVIRQYQNDAYPHPQPLRRVPSAAATYLLARDPEREGALPAIRRAHPHRARNHNRAEEGVSHTEVQHTLSWLAKSTKGHRDTRATDRAQTAGAADLPPAFAADTDFEPADDQPDDRDGREEQNGGYDQTIDAIQAAHSGGSAPHSEATRSFRPAWVETTPIHLEVFWHRVPRAYRRRAAILLPDHDLHFLPRPDHFRACARLLWQAIQAGELQASAGARWICAAIQ